MGRITTRNFSKLILILSLQLSLLAAQSCSQSNGNPTPVETDNGAVLGDTGEDGKDSDSDNEPAPVKRMPIDVNFINESLRRHFIDGYGDNWCVTWAEDGSQITSMSDGSWVPENRTYHNMAYRIEGEADNFSRSKLAGYPEFLYGAEDEPGWFGYGIVAIDDTIYSMVTKVPGTTFESPFLGIKMLKSSDNGETWFRVNRHGETRLIEPTDYQARNSTEVDEMFFWKEFGSDVNGKTYYPFSFASFVQNGQAGQASPDGYIYIYSPEGARAHELLLARAKKEDFEQRSKWEYFKGWNGDQPLWSSNIEDRGAVIEFPQTDSDGNTHGWYSWLPSVVWNEGLGVYIMANGGTYTNNYNWETLDLSGSLGFWYSENPYGPWTQFYYDEHFTVDDPRNRFYQPKLSPKWISEDGEEMVLIWSDAMADEEGNTHTVNYKWNQIKIRLQIAGNQIPSTSAGDDQSISFANAKSGQVFLNGIISDDGLPTGSTLNSKWSKISGPGIVTFNNTNQAQTSATFDQAGSYELQLRASDGELSKSDKVTVTVLD